MEHLLANGHHSQDKLFAGDLSFNANFPVRQMPVLRSVTWKMNFKKFAN